MEYIELVNRIVTAEHNAKEIAREAKEREEALDSDLEREIAKVRKDYFARADRRIQMVRDTEAEAAEEDIQASDKRLEEALAAVEAAREKYRDNWVDTLFHMIVGGQT